MIKNFTRPEVKKIVEHQIVFLYKDDINFGFSFPCDESGIVVG